MKSLYHGVARKFKSLELIFKVAELTCHGVTRNFLSYKDTSLTINKFIFNYK